MPHGGGHAGGGGGGFHSHAHHHHHSHQQHYTSHRSAPVTTTGGDDDDNTLLIMAILAAAVCVIIFAIIFLIAPVAGTYNDYSATQSLVVAPGDTRLTPRSSSACQGISVTTGTAAVNSSLYLLRNTPSLLSYSSFTFSGVAVVPDNGDYEYWSFHLYPGSKYSFAACLTLGYSVEYYVIKGTNNYDNWVEYPTNDRVYGNSILQVKNLCGISNATGSLTFTSEDDYFFIFYNGNSYYSTVEVTFSFERTEYLPESGNIISNCTATSRSSCSLDIPYASDYVALLQISPPADGQWDANVDVSTSCSARGWVYVVIEFSMVVLVLLCALSCVACFCHKKIKKACCERSHKPSRSSSTPASNATSATAETISSPVVPENSAVATEVTSVPSSVSHGDTLPKNTSAIGTLTTPLPSNYEQGINVPPGPPDSMDLPPNYDIDRPCETWVSPLPS